MRSLVLRAAAILLALALLTVGVGAQSKKKRKARTAKATTSKTTKAAQQPYTGDPTPPVQLPEQGDGVQRITAAEARAAVDKGTAIIVDVRAAESYGYGHIKGALNVPVNEFISRLKDFPRGKMIITYCS